MNAISQLLYMRLFNPNVLYLKFFPTNCANLFQSLKNAVKLKNAISQFPVHTLSLHTYIYKHYIYYIKMHSVKIFACLVKETEEMLVKKRPLTDYSNQLGISVEVRVLFHVFVLLVSYHYTDKTKPRF